MKNIFSLCLGAFAMVLVGACSEGSDSNPVAPADQSSLTAVTGAAHGGRHNDSPILLCHANPDGDDGDPIWVVIEVDDNSHKEAGHLRHGDLASGDCVSGDLSEAEVGDDCCVCATGSGCNGPI